MERHRIRITYCVPWDYSDRAVRTVEELLHDYQHVIDELTVVTGSKGVFDVELDGELLFSKRAVGRHAKPGEVLERFRAALGPGVEAFER